MRCADKHKTIGMIYSQHTVYALSKQAAWFGKSVEAEKWERLGAKPP